MRLSELAKSSSTQRSGRKKDGSHTDKPLVVRFYGVTENQREIDMDMREMVDKVKKGESLYGRSELTEHMQGVAHRNSRYSGVFLHIVPMFNFVNHPYVSPMFAEQLMYNVLINI